MCCLVQWGTAGTTTSGGSAVVVEAAALPEGPVVVISAPDVTGRCDALRIDLSRSVGAGGRDWASVAVAALGDDAVDTADGISKRAALNDALSSINWVDGGFRGTLAATDAVFNSPATYRLHVTMCNFLGQCGQATHSVTVLPSTNVPLVHISGSRMQTLRVDQPLVLVASASLLTDAGRPTSLDTADKCSEVEDAAFEMEGLVFTWAVTTAGGAPRNVHNAEASAERLVLAPFSLPSRERSVVTVTVSALDDPLVAASYSVVVDVAPAPLVAVVMGGSLRSVGPGATVFLDASASFDANVHREQALGPLTGLKFAWSCQMAYSGLDGPGCGLVASPTGAQGSKFKMAFHTPTDDDSTTYDSLDTESIVTLVVTRPGDPSLRTVVREVVVRGVDADLPTVLITGVQAGSGAFTTDSRAVVNPGEKLSVVAAVGMTVQAATMGEGSANYAIAEWSISPALSLSLAALSPTTIDLDAAAALFTGESVSWMPGLLVDAYSLTPGLVYTFTLAVTCDAGTVSSAVAVAANAPPVGGHFQASPATGGTEYSTLFTLQALFWRDSDLPLQYTFGYLDLDLLERVPLQDRSPEEELVTMLPAGQKGNSRFLLLSTGVFDALGANSTAEITVPVGVPSGSSTEAGRVSKLQRELSLRRDTYAEVESDDGRLAFQGLSQAKQTMGLVLSGLNTPALLFEDVESFPSAQCALRNRMPSVEASLTCGACKGPTYFGVLGLSNSECVDVTSNLTANKVSTVLRQDKVCPAGVRNGECGGNGECKYYHTLDGSVVDECTVSDTDCYPACVCVESHAGPSCDYVLALTTERSLLRVETAAYLQEVLAYDAAPTTAEAFEARARLLRLLCERPNELAAVPNEFGAVPAVSPLLDVVAVLADTAALAVAHGIPSTAAVALLETVNVLMDASMAQFPWQDVSAAAKDLNSALLGIVDTLALLTALEQTTGGAAGVAVYSQFRFVGTVVDLSSPAAGSALTAQAVSVQLPLTNRDVLMRASLPLSGVVFETVASEWGRAEPMHVVVSQVPARNTPLVHEITSDVVRMQGPRTVCNTTSAGARAPNVIFTMPLRDPILFGLAIAATARNFTCLVNDRTTLYSFTCPVDDVPAPNTGTVTEEVQCDGSYQTGVVTCPDVFRRPACSFLHSDGESWGEDCVVLTSRQDFLVCSCSVCEAPGLDTSAYAAGGVGLGDGDDSDLRLRRLDVRGSSEAWRRRTQGIDNGSGSGSGSGVLEVVTRSVIEAGSIAFDVSEPVPPYLPPDYDFMVSIVLVFIFGWFIILAIVGLSEYIKRKELARNNRKISNSYQDRRDAFVRDNNVSTLTQADELSLGMSAYLDRCTLTLAPKLTPHADHDRFSQIPCNLH